MSAAIGHGSESKSTDWQPAHSTAYRCHYLFKSSPSSPSFCQRISRRLSKASRARRRHASVSAQASMNEAPSKTDISSLKGQSLSTVLLAHLGNAQGADLYRIFMSLQVNLNYAFCCMQQGMQLCTLGPILTGSLRQPCGMVPALSTFVQGGVKSLAHLLSRAGMDNLSGVYEGASESAERDQAQKLDVISVLLLLVLLVESAALISGSWLLHDQCSRIGKTGSWGSMQGCVVRVLVGIDAGRGEAQTTAAVEPGQGMPTCLTPYLVCRMTSSKRPSKTPDASAPLHQRRKMTWS